MKCPLLVMSKTYVVGAQKGDYGDCLQEECAWWNERFGMCSQAVDAYLKGVADRRQEIHEEMKERRRLP